MYVRRIQTVAVHPTAVLPIMHAELQLQCNNISNIAESSAAVWECFIALARTSDSVLVVLPNLIVCRSFWGGSPPCRPIPPGLLPPSQLFGQMQRHSWSETLCSMTRYVALPPVALAACPNDTPAGGMPGHAFCSCISESLVSKRIKGSCHSSGVARLTHHCTNLTAHCPTAYLGLTIL